jgi:hypothetical protein
MKLRRQIKILNFFPKILDNNIFCQIENIQYTIIKPFSFTSVGLFSGEYLQGAGVSDGENYSENYSDVKSYTGLGGKQGLAEGYTPYTE